MKDLIERLEKATGPDHELGRAVLLACGWSKTCVGYYMGQQFYWGSPDRKITFDDDFFHRYDPTRSIDAALTLVPEGMSWAIKSPGFQSLSKKYRVHLETGDDEWSAEGWTAPAAVCIAAFKVRS